MSIKHIKTLSIFEICNFLADSLKKSAESNVFFSAGIVISFEANDALWNLITYCAATGGSLLVIGSAAGVAFMGMERQVSFGWCLGNFEVSLLTCVFGGKSDSPLASSLRPDPR